MSAVTPPKNVPTQAAVVSGTGPAAAGPLLSVVERRILGVLVEKAKTTPDAYPLSLNALATGCNQKSNRDPLLNLADFEVEQGLESLQKQRLVGKIVGGRVDRWRHFLYECWHVDKVELAVLAELLLRGPQTEGELRSRAARMEPIDDLDLLRTVLRGLKERGLIVYLTPEGRRGTTVTHGFHTREELEHLRAQYAGEAIPSAAPLAASAPPGGPTALETQLAETRSEVTDLRARLADLESRVDDLAAELRTLKESLGA